MTLSAKSSATVRTSIVCLFDPGEGSGIIEADVLTALPLGPGELEIDMLVTEKVTAGGYAIDVEVSVPMSVPSGSLVPANVTLK